MEKVSAMKKVALFLMIVGLAVAVVACQGAVGPQGPPGEDGTDGTDGTSGMDGVDGISPITKASGVTPDPILLNVRSTTDQTISTSTVATVDTTVYFSGGQEPILYEIVEAVTDGTSGDFFTATIDKDSGVLTVKAKSGGTLDANNDYAMGETVKVKATDANKVTPVADGADDPVILTIRANKAPTVVPNQMLPVTIGTQAAADATRDGVDDADGEALTGADIPNPICAMFASCVFTINTGTGAMIVPTAMFTLLDVEDGTAASEVTVFTDNDVRGSTLSVVEYDAKYVTASATGTTFTIGGVKSTFIADTDGTVGPEAHTATVVRLRATDANELWVEFNVNVSVDGAPTLSTTHQFNAAYSIKTNQAMTSIIPNVARFFTDVESTVSAAFPTYKVTSSNRAVAEVGMEPVDSDGDLVLGSYAEGTTTITITATDARGQSVSDSFVLNVTRADI